MAVSGPTETRGEPQVAAEPESFSAFGARVLNQLSLSAWLPGAFFIASTALLAWFAAKKAITLQGIGTFVEDNWIPALVLALPTLVVTTLLTQAFSFEAIRSLEGYWRRRGPATWLRTACIKFQLHRLHSLTKRQKEATIEAFNAALPALLKRSIDGLVLRAVQAEITNQPDPPGLSDEQQRQVVELRWWEVTNAWDSAKLLRLRRDLGEFPKESRVMPTKLGNVLRVAEDQLKNANGDVEGFVMRNREFVPPRVLTHHDQFRTRLDMYCTLVFVSAAAAAISVPVLWALPPLDQVIVPLALLAISRASYGAALSSARGYRTVLRQIDNAVSEARVRAT